VSSEDGESRSDLGLGFPAGFTIDRKSGAAYAELLAESGNVIYELGARVDVPEEFDTEFSPRFGISFRPGAGATRLRASVGRGFKLPSFFALATPVVGEPNLVPETVWGADAGIEHEFETAGLTASVTVFYNRFDELITFVGSIFKHANLPDVESGGVEIAIDWKPDGPVSFAASATRQEFDQDFNPSVDDGPPEPLTNRPEWFGSARVLWRINERTRWQLDAQVVSGSFDFLTDPFGGMPVPLAGYQLFGTSASRKVGRRFEVHARVDNLADKDYQPRIGFPGPDRTYRFGLRYR
jgi:outer membrane receptor protein involved in Fe transport